MIPPVPGTLALSPMTERRRLLGPAELAEQGPPEAVRLPLDLIDPNPLNPRKELPDIEGLAANIKRLNGLIEPIAVWRTHDRYMLLSGHRRWAAFLQLAEQEPSTEVQWRTIPAVIKSADEATAELILVSAEVHHERWKPREEAPILERWHKGGLSLGDIGTRLNKSMSWVSYRLGVYADPVLSPLVLNEQLAVTVAQEFVRITSPEDRNRLAEQAVTEGWSQPRARLEVRRLFKSEEVRHLGTQARAMMEVLAGLDASQIPIEDAKALNELARLITRLARGSQRVIPTIEAAERAAGVKPRVRTRKEQPRRRTMPRPS